MRYCGQCGSPNTESARFCTNCGAKLSEWNAGETQAVSEDKQQTAAPQPEMQQTAAPQPEMQQPAMPQQQAQQTAAPYTATQPQAQQTAAAQPGSGEISVLSILAFIFAFIFPFAGLILGIIDLCMGDGRKKGLSIAAVVISAVWAVVVVFAILVPLTLLAGIL